MLQITPQQTIFIAINPVDFRKGIDGLAALCRSQLNHDPFSGALFVFTNRQRTAVKIIVYDGQGFWLCMKRFSQGKLAGGPHQAVHKPIRRAQNPRKCLIFFWPVSCKFCYIKAIQKKQKFLKIGDKSSGHQRRTWTIRWMLRFLILSFHHFLVISGKPILGGFKHQ